MTEKSRGGSTTLSTTLYESTYGGGFVPIATYNYISAVDEEYMNGVNIPNFHKRLREGELLPMTGFTQYMRKSTRVSGLLEYSESVAPYRHAYWAPSVPYDISYYAPNQLTLAGLLSGSDYHYLVQAAAARIFSSGWDVGTFTGELQQTINMFVGLLEKIIGMLRRKPPGTPWDLWLEGRYGWRTLNYDIDDVIKVLVNLDDGRKRFRDRCTSRNSWTDATSSSATGLAQIDYYSSVIVYEISTRGTVVADIEPPRFSFNPVITWWELTKFSFMIDWFLNVGQWLAALNFLALSTNYTAAGGLLIKADRTYAIGAEARPNWTIIQNDRTVVSESSLTYRIPTSISSIPQLKLRLDVSKLIDLLALLVQFKVRS